MTITEIAKKANVSIGTVDRILHNRGHVSPQKKEAIEKVIKRYGYKPNPLAKHLKMNRFFVIGVIIPNLKSEAGYWNMAADGIKKAVKELEPFSVSIIISEFDRTLTGSFSKAGNLLFNKVNALIIAPTQNNECQEFINNKLSIPYALIDSPLPEAKPVTTVVQDPYKSGYCAGRMMSILCPKAKHLVSIQMYKDTYNLKERARGFKDFFQYDNSISINEIIYTVDNAINIKNHKTLTNQTARINFLLQQILSKDNNIDGIFITNDAVHQAADFLSTYTYNKKITLIGYDLLPQNKNGLANSTIDCVISQDPEQQGYEAVRALYRKEILLQKVDSLINIPINTYFKENI